MSKVVDTLFARKRREPKGVRKINNITMGKKTKNR